MEVTPTAELVAALAAAVGHPKREAAVGRAAALLAARLSAIELHLGREAATQRLIGYLGSAERRIARRAFLALRAAGWPG